MNRELGSIIARRKYFGLGDPSQTTLVEVEIGTPARSPQSGDEFMCSFSVTSQGSEQTETVYGIDELQALQLALGHLDAALRRLKSSSGLQLRWIGDETGDLGIRIPTFTSG